jgi:hypothetical protein
MSTSIVGSVSDADVSRAEVTDVEEEDDDDLNTPIVTIAVRMHPIEEAKKAIFPNSIEFSTSKTRNDARNSTGTRRMTVASCTMKPQAAAATLRITHIQPFETSAQSSTATSVADHRATDHSQLYDF